MRISDRFTHSFKQTTAIDTLTLWPTTVGLAFVMWLTWSSSLQAAPSTCDAILTHAMYNIRVTHSTEATIATKYFNHCHKDFVSLSEEQMGRVELDIFSAITGSAGATLTERAERLTEWCQTNQETAQSNRYLYEVSQTIYSDSVRAWDACNQLLLRSHVHIDPDISHDQKSVQFTIRYTGGTRSGITLYKPLVEGFGCVVNDQQGNVIGFLPGQLPEITNEAIPIRCKRKLPKVQVVNGQEYRVVPRGVLGIITGQEHVLVSFAEEWDPSIPEQAATRLSQEINALYERIDTLEGHLKDLFDGSAPRDETAVGETVLDELIPAGKVMLITASAIAEAAGAFRSYLTLEILVDSESRAQSQSYVPGNWLVGHNVSTSYILQHSPTPYKIRIRARGEGLKKTPSIRFQTVMVNDDENRVSTAP
jgi:hypothetical protein